MNRILKARTQGKILMHRLQPGERMQILISFCKGPLGYPWLAEFNW